MKTLIVTESVRILGDDYQASDEPIEVVDAVAAEMLKFGFGKEADAVPDGGTAGDTAGSTSESGTSGDSESSKQASLFPNGNTTE